MLFNSIQFLIFFPAVTALYFGLPHRLRWAWLLAASCYFYMAFMPSYILILGFTIVIDYFAGLAIENAEGRRRKLFLAASLAANVGVLVVFKYFNFLNANLKGLAEALRWNYPVESLAILLPIGLSFHTFQAMSYTIEVYRGAQPAERHFGIYALYVMFYPQLVAGPIERPQNLLHQFREVHRFDYERVASGLRLMAWGFFKKIVVADRLAVPVNLVYGEPEKHTGLALLVATYFFAYQIYCDFSGYTDIARGAARVMGFELMKNFDRPYAARSVAEFWTRWHISLSTWFKDYLFFPLARWHAARRARHAATGRAPAARPAAAGASAWRYFDIYVVFLVSGVWHGANWTFVLWGALHGTYLVASLVTKPLRAKAARWTGLARLPKLHNFVRVFVVFHLVAFAWIFFRAGSVADALHVVSNLLTDLSLRDALTGEISTKLGTPRTDLLVSVLLVGLLELAQYLRARRPGRPPLAGLPGWQRWAFYYALVAAILFLGEYQSNQFIYFQF